MPSTSALLQSQSSSLECEKEGLSMRSNSQQQLGAKVEIVYNLLSLLENNNSIQSSYQSVSVLLAMSKSPDCCAAMRQTGMFYRSYINASCIMVFYNHIHQKMGQNNYFVFSSEQ